MRTALSVGFVVLAAFGLASTAALAGVVDSKDPWTVVDIPSAPDVPTVDAGRPALLAPNAAWIAAVAAAAGISPVAVRAYGTATLEVGHTTPGCHLGWTTLAGIGQIETGHGTHGAAHLRDDGITSTLILGPALDGSSGMASIHATAESARWHGDPVWDHAVGPMQFIPSTWRRWASDGDHDGIANPNDIDDAALAAGRYLCSAGGDLATAAGWSRAVLAFNHSRPYLSSVLAAANEYSAAAPL